jgi:hypothetical protein
MNQALGMVNQVAQGWEALRGAGRCFGVLAGSWSSSSYDRPLAAQPGQREAQSR